MNDEHKRFWDGAMLPLLGYCEHLVLMNKALWQMAQKNCGDWKEQLTTEMQAAQTDGQIHRRFEALYQSMGDEQKFHEAVQYLVGIKHSL